MRDIDLKFEMYDSSRNKQANRFRMYRFWLSGIIPKFFGIL